jgi:hypothetical protein
MTDIVKLDDNELEFATGGLNTAGEMPVMHLYELSQSELQYYLVGMCPKCRKPSLKTAERGAMSCVNCNIKYIA